jgi:glycosyltransferase 2 family protein
MIATFKRHPYLNLLKIMIGVAFLILSFWGVDWPQLSRSLNQISLGWLLIVIASVIGGLLLKIGRSYLLLKNFRAPVSLRKAAEAFFMGQAVNILLPSRGGDLVRLGYLSTDQTDRFPEVTAALALEKFLDLIAMTVIALGVVAYLPADRALWVRTWLLPISVIASVGLILLISIGPMLWQQVKVRLPGQTYSIVKKVIGLVDQLVASSLWLRNPKRILPSIGITAVIWLAMWATNQLLFHGIGLDLPLSAGGLVVVLIYIGVLPALMPGNVGPFYFFAQLGVAPFGTHPEDAVAFAILLHAIVTLIPLSAAGLALLFSVNLRGKLGTLWNHQ